MNDDAASAQHGPVSITEGPFSGWMTWSRGADPYETLLGPFCFKLEGERVCSAFEPKPHHLNGGGKLHGGALMSFADFSLFSIAHKSLSETVRAVTLSCNCEFLSAGDLDGWIEAQGEVLRETRSIIFARGLITQRGRAVLAFSGALKKIGF